MLLKFCDLNASSARALASYLLFLHVVFFLVFCSLDLRRRICANHVHYQTNFWLFLLWLIVVVTFFSYTHFLLLLFCVQSPNRFQARNRLESTEGFEVIKNGKKIFVLILRRTDFLLFLIYLKRTKRDVNSSIWGKSCHIEVEINN